MFASLHSRTSYNSPKLMASYLVLLTIKLRVPLFLGILNFLECPRLPSTCLGRNHKLVAGGVPTFLPSCHFIIVGSGERKPAAKKKKMGAGKDVKQALSSDNRGSIPSYF
ncbi:hypothetical protein I7I50_11081 [Histoplasma capsulatum G186AR]|uniref:Uncharacterized protein n=1 Tax=Ajellomyces capsulatus TaxID=5037 RepID=A0A8H7Z7B9_AJECA|nr:hypothetical protein I7I52_02320 [Histoplasma capsulatum]QSS69699.1 hypothetical protein I7I50_11081 [Histoplasma capsulatum G186AR]